MSLGHTLPTMLKSKHKASIDKGNGIVRLAFALRLLVSKRLARILGTDF